MAGVWFCVLNDYGIILLNKLVDIVLMSVGSHLVRIILCGCQLKTRRRLSAVSPSVTENQTLPRRFSWWAAVHPRTLCRSCPTPMAGSSTSSSARSGWLAAGRHTGCKGHNKKGSNADLSATGRQPKHNTQMEWRMHVRQIILKKKKDSHHSEHKQHLNQLIKVQKECVHHFHSPVAIC